ncbi:MAG TPA: glycosyltransferase [Candidatus Dormibacteraeota bacterium]|nr:glycosyltransferase [Candidatus Dormibacteraeota bacterium]
MAPFFIFIAAVLFLLAASISRCFLAAILRWAIPSAGVKKDYSYQPTVSILLPCYNEGQTVYETIESISKSNYPNNKFEIIAQDDCSIDDSYKWMLKAQQDFTNIQVRVGRNSINSGKARTVCNALQHSLAEIVISIDSDCIFHSDCIQELIACFVEPKMGAVGGRVGVRNVNASTATMVQTFYYYLAFQLIKTPESMTRSVGCISGCIFAIRRELLLKLESRIRNRNWFGIQVNDGEDRFLTHQVLLEGYGTYINTAAQCWTNVPVTLLQLIKQQIRWRRSGIRDFFLTLKTLPQHVWKLHPNTVYTLVVPPLASLLSVCTVLMAPFTNAAFWIAPVMFILYGAGAAIFDVVIRKHNPEQRVLNPLRLATFAVWGLGSILITVLALCTFDSSDWGTRSKKAPQPEAKLEPLRLPLARPEFATSGD